MINIIVRDVINLIVIVLVYANKLHPIVGISIIVASSVILTIRYIKKEKLSNQTK